ncbi:MAG: UbiD family decarboxylase, partial [Deinococcus sp.]|nr:UbiD family decarboxylase [Deinococcus sp.]
KRYPGHAYKVMNALWGQGQLMLAKVIVVFDADVDVHDVVGCWQRALSSIDVGCDVHFTPGPVDVLDHASHAFSYGTKLGIDATSKLPEELSRGDVRPAPARTPAPTDLEALRVAVPELKRCHLGAGGHLLFVTIQKRAPYQVRQVLQALWAQRRTPVPTATVVLDDDVEVHNPQEVWWVALNNIDARRDVALGPDASVPTHLGIDATRKWPEEGFTRRWPERLEMSSEIKQQVDRRWGELGIVLPLEGR